MNSQILPRIIRQALIPPWFSIFPVHYYSCSFRRYVLCSCSGFRDFSMTFFSGRILRSSFCVRKIITSPWSARIWYWIFMGRLQKKSMFAKEIYKREWDLILSDKNSSLKTFKFHMLRCKNQDRDNSRAVYITGTRLSRGEMEFAFQKQFFFFVERNNIFPWNSVSWVLLQIHGRDLVNSL